jgi:hypothetical protein
MMNEEAEAFVAQFGAEPNSWTIEESDYGTTIHFIASNGRSMECHIESSDLHDAVVVFLKERGATVKRLEDPRKN